MTWLYAFIAIFAATGWGAFCWAMFQREKLQDRIDDLYSRPLSFWQHREVMRTLASSLTLERFAAAKPIPPSDDRVVKFRRPPPFGPSVDVPFKGKVR